MKSTSPDSAAWTTPRREIAKPVDRAQKRAGFDYYVVERHLSKINSKGLTVTGLGINGKSIMGRRMKVSILSAQFPPFNMVPWFGFIYFAIQKRVNFPFKRNELLTVSLTKDAAYQNDFFVLYVVYSNIIRSRWMFFSSSVEKLFCRCFDQFHTGYWCV